MLKGLFAGLVAGALITACVLKAAAKDKPANAGAAETAAFDSASLKAEADALDAETTALQKKLEEATAAIASAEAKPEKGKKGKKKSAPKTWKDIAPLLAKAFQMERGGEEVDDETRKKFEMLQLEMMGILARIAKQRGISIEEALGAPEGLPEMMKALLESAQPPPTEDQLARLDALRAEYAKAWEEARKNGELTKLESRLAMSDLMTRLGAGYSDILTAEQKEAAGKADWMEMFMGGMGGNQRWMNGTRETVQADLAKQWGDALKLGDSQRTRLAPYVEEFMKEHDAIQARFREEAQTADRDSDWWRREQRAQVEAQVRLRRKMAAELGLTEEQAAAMKNWATTYSFWIDQGKEPPAPEAVQDGGGK